MSALFFYRNADNFSEQCLDDQAGVGVMRRDRRKRTSLAANERFPVGLLKCDCSAQFLQQIQGGRESDVSALFRELITMFFRQSSRMLARRSRELSRLEMLDIR